jgi:asparagine synthase (glutamine-hydrolysing)
VCGIGGVFRFDGQPCVVPALEQMSLAMRERGPDDHGQYVGSGIGLVHRRLSIIDLSALGRCPMSNEDGSIQVVLNGEIYNFKELRNQLVARGHTFKSSSDTEVIVHGYEEWGKDVVARLDGMFALAVWDNRQRQLLLARDRAGEKPLYYMVQSGDIVFASSLSALHAYSQGALEIDSNALDCFLSHAFIPGPHTIWKAVKSFPPAHCALVTSNGKFQLERYWNVPDQPPLKISVHDAERFIEEKLQKSVSARLVADVPVGGFLSGGVDSSLVMALAARQHAKINTFSIGFKEAEFSELPYARQVAQAIGSQHHEQIVTENDLFDVLPELVWQLGQPFGDSSIVPTYLLSKFTRRSVTVSLSGDGGDETFAGYWRHESGWYASVYRKLLPAWARTSTVPFLARNMRRIGAAGMGTRLAALNEMSLATRGAGYTNAQTWFNHRDAIFGGLGRSRAADHDPIACRVTRPWDGKYNSDLRQLLYDDFQVLLPDDYLMKVDVASMGSSLEVRTPFLDHHFIEAAWLLPDSMKLHFGQRKWLLKRIAAKYVPRSVVYRKKMGFAMPVKHWWRGRLAEILKTLMQDSRAVANGWIEQAPVQHAIAEHVSARAKHDVRLWTILCLELWARVVVDKTLSRTTSLREFLN